MHKLAAVINSGTSLFIDLTFKDHNDVLINPTSMVWNVKDVATGSVVIANTVVTEFDNGTYTIQIGASNNLLINPNNSTETRVVGITYTYGGNNFSMTQEAIYEIKALSYIPSPIVEIDATPGAGPIGPQGIQGPIGPQGSPYNVENIQITLLVSNYYTSEMPDNIEEIISDIGDNIVTLYLDSYYTITGNVIFPQNISIIVLPKGCFSISPDSTLVIDGVFHAPNTQCFTGTFFIPDGSDGTVKFTHTTVSPFWWGANYLTNSRDAFQAALYAGDVKATGYFKIDNTLNMMDRRKFRGENLTLDYLNAPSGKYFISAIGNIEEGVPLTSAAQRFDTTINAEGHGLEEDDYILLESQRNALSDDAGEWQLGYPTGSYTGAYFAEVFQVKTIIDEDNILLSGGVIFPDYLTDNSQETGSDPSDPITKQVKLTRVVKPDTGKVTSQSYIVEVLNGGTTDDIFGSMTVVCAGYVKAGVSSKISAVINDTSFKMTVPALASAENIEMTFIAYSQEQSMVRKIDFLSDIEISGIHFIARSIATTNHIHFKWTRDSKVINCTFDMGVHKGYGIEFNNCFRCEGINNFIEYAPDSPSDVGLVTHDPSYNGCKIVSSWYCGYISSTIIHSSQPFDVTYYNNGYPSVYSYIKDCKTLWAKGNGMTTHSGAYGVLIDSCQFLNCARGVVLRNREIIFTNNIISGLAKNLPEGKGRSVGLGFGDGFGRNGIVSNNLITGFWHGVLISNYQSLGVGFVNLELTISNNHIKNVVNGIYLSYDNNESDTTKESGIRLMGNTISEIEYCGIFVDTYANGCSIMNNTIKGPILNTTNINNVNYGYAIYIANNTVRTSIINNRLIDIGETNYAIKLPSISDRVTFPEIDYPTSLSKVFNNTVTGGTTLDVNASSNALPNELIAGNSNPNKRTWSTPTDATLILSSGGASELYLCSSGDAGNSRCEIHFTPPDSYSTGGSIVYNLVNDTMYQRIGGAWTTTLTSTYFAPYGGGTPATLALGLSTARWTTIYGNNLDLDGASVKMSALPIYADNAAALTGNLGVGKMYRTSTGQVMIVYTP